MARKKVAAISPLKRGRVSCVGLTNKTRILLQIRALEDCKGKNSRDTIKRKTLLSEKKRKKQ